MPGKARQPLRYFRRNVARRNGQIDPPLQSAKVLNIGVHPQKPFESLVMARAGC
ncbi:MAG TPA: hypothetical protein VMQ45_02615 [Burkholderiaceae bacterium]|nr:hypothetical protein [Burkholderiaceae bacterium]